MQTESSDGLISSFQRWLHPARIALAVFFLAVMRFTRPVNIGSDAFWYVSDIRTAMSHPWNDSAPLWEFAHLLWRPLGRMLAEGLLPLVKPLVSGDERAAVTLLLVSLSCIAACLSCFLIQSFVWRLTGKPWIATLAAGAFLGFNPLLNDSREGVPYLVGFTFSLAAFYVLAFASDSRRAGIGAGILSALAAAFWVPFLFSLPAVLLTRHVLRTETLSLRSFDFRGPALTVLSCGALLGVLYGLVLYEAHISNVPAFRAWMVRSTAGVSGRDRTLVRMVTGMVRMFYNLGQDSIWFKWYLFHDPYARVGLGELFRVSLARIVMFYGTLAALVLWLWPAQFGRRILILLLFLAGPHIGLALMSESGAAERYLAALGLVAIGLGYVAGNSEFGRWKRAFAAVLCCMPLFLNVAVADASSAEAAIQHDVDRISALLHGPAATRLYVINLQDSLVTLSYAAPFHPIQRETLPRIDTIKPFAGEMPWQDIFTCGALSAWDAGGAVWITDRVLRKEPLREWLWVEGDSKKITWEAVHHFFSSLDRGEESGSDDGFFKLKETAENRLALTGNKPGSTSCISPVPANSIPPSSTTPIADR